MFFITQSQLEKLQNSLTSDVLNLIDYIVVEKEYALSDHQFLVISSILKLAGFKPITLKELAADESLHSNRLNSSRNLTRILEELNGKGIILYHLETGVIQFNAFKHEALFRLSQNKEDRGAESKTSPAAPASFLSEKLINMSVELAKARKSLEDTIKTDKKRKQGEDSGRLSKKNAFEVINDIEKQLRQLSEQYREVVVKSKDQNVVVTSVNSSQAVIPSTPFKPVNLTSTPVQLAAGTRTPLVSPLPFRPNPLVPIAYRPDLSNQEDEPEMLEILNSGPIVKGDNVDRALSHFAPSNGERPLLNLHSMFSSATSPQKLGGFVEEKTKDEDEIRLSDEEFESFLVTLTK